MLQPLKQWGSLHHQRDQDLEVKAEIKAYLHEKCKEDIEKYREQQAENEEYTNKCHAALEDSENEEDEPPPKKTKTWDARKVHAIEFNEKSGSLNQ